MDKSAIIPAIIAFAAQILLCPICIPLLHRLKFGQYIRAEGPKEHQKKARDEAEAAEAARCWQHVETIRWADNSVEEVYKDKDGNIKHVMTVGPHGDAC